MLNIYNSLSKKVEKFEPLQKGEVTMYACGPTVYDYSHIGHGRKYVTDDILKKVLREVEGLKVKHVQNITDVGHLVSDADEGEDKMEKGAKKSGKTVWEVAEEYTKYHWMLIDTLGVERPDVSCKATDHIQEQIEMIKKLVEKGYAYDTQEAVYFEVEKFADYDKLFNQDRAEKLVGAREEVEIENSKKNPSDFVLWFKRVGKYADHVMYWSSPWGDGFPGWHIECSAMSMKYLGEQIDVHTGGEDHISVHHPNEIAQSEAASGKKPFVKYWLHTSFLMVDGRKMSKSLGNLYRIEDVKAKGFTAEALRYYYLTTHYRKTMNFSWEGLLAAAAASKKLNRMYLELSKGEGGELSGAAEKFKRDFTEAMEDDLNTARALAVIWELMRSEVSDGEKKTLLDFFEAVLGLGLGRVTDEEEISEEALRWLRLRNQLRSEKRWEEADEARKKIEEMGYVVKDHNGESVIEKGR